MKTKRAHWSEVLVRHGACADAVAWARKQPTAAKAWASCERADWMLWIAGKMAGPLRHASRRPLVLAACACARTVLKHVPKTELRPLRAIEMAEAWARGGKKAPSLEEVRDAADAAYAYAYAYAAAAYAARASAADAARYAAAYAAAAYAAAAYAAQAKSFKDMAKLVRKFYPKHPKAVKRR